MKPIKIAFLWHQHQPYYLSDGEFILPWVRFHAVKDYLEMLLILQQYPTLKQTYNIVPSLFKQIEFYLNGVKDKVQILTEISANKLNSKQKQEILNQFFVCNYENMIKPYSAYELLYQKFQSLIEFTEQDYLNLQVWYNLTWFGVETRKKDKVISNLFKKDNFSETDKIIVLEKHLEIMIKIVPLFKSMQDNNNIEISVSPFYHPILPLVIDTNIYNESSPDKYLPYNRFQFPADAEQQIQLSIDYYNSLFDVNPKGVWSSEGSLSNQTLDLLADKNIKWTASDEKLLFNTIGYDNTKAKYFPIKFKNNINIFFRDTHLSDKIGFEYSQLDSKLASDDFINNILNIKSSLNEDDLENIVVSIILDGENCWEFYPNNGNEFLHSLYIKLSQENNIQTVTFDQSCNLKSNINLTHLKAGSWINANFDIWLGHQEDRLAWDILYDVRLLFESKRNLLSQQIEKEILELVYICEGSDWFWWFGKEFRATNRKDFDLLFRNNIAKIYTLLNINIPDIINKPIMDDENLSAINKMEYFTEPVLNGKLNDWNGAGSYFPKYELSAMNVDNLLLEKILWYFDDDNIYLKVFINQDWDLISLSLQSNDNELFSINFGTISNANINHFVIDETLDLSIPKLIFNNNFKFNLIIESNNTIQSYPIYSKSIDII